MKRIELLDRAPWQERLLVGAAVRSKAARARLREIGITRAILGHEPEAMVIVAHALSERGGTPDHVSAALNHRIPGHLTWAETLATAPALDDASYVRDAERCAVALAKRWMPEHLRWALEGIEAGDWSRLKPVFDLADLIRAIEAREAA